METKANKKSSGKFTRAVFQALKYAVLIFCCFLVIVPLVVVLIGAFKTHDEYISTGVFDLPSVPQFENFKIAFINGRVMQGLVNTIIILAVSCFGTIITGTMTAFVLQRFRTIFTRGVKAVFLFASLLPNISMQVTVFQIVSKLGLYDSLAAPCVLYIGTDIISIYIFMQFLDNISLSLDESAFLDGAGYPRIYWSIILPLLRPAIATVLVIKFVSFLYAKPLHAQQGVRCGINRAVQIYRTLFSTMGDYFCWNNHMYYSDADNFPLSSEVNLQQPCNGFCKRVIWSFSFKFEIFRDPLECTIFRFAACCASGSREKFPAKTLRCNNFLYKLMSRPLGAAHIRYKIKYPAMPVPKIPPK